MSLYAELRALDEGFSRLAAALAGADLERCMRARTALETLRLRLRDPQAERVITAWLSLTALFDDLNPRTQPSDDQLAEIVKQHGVRGAARRLGISKTTVSRRLKASRGTPK